MPVAFEPALRLARRAPFVFAVSLLVSACGGGPSSANRESSTPTSAKAAEPGSSPAAKASEPTPAEPPKAALSFPTACAKEGGDVCVPAASFVKHLCAAPNASSLALALFAKGTPWVRMYLARNTEAWDAATGSGGGAMKLAFDEEVLVLAYRPANPNGMIVSGANGAYDILRWDGTCASLNGDELRKWYPPEPGFAEIPWRKLDDEMQQKLLGDGRIALKEGEMKKACKGLSRTQTNAACEKAQKSLSKAVVAYVRVGGALAQPKMP